LWRGRKIVDTANAATLKYISYYWFNLDWISGFQSAPGKRYRAKRKKGQKELGDAAEERRGEENER